MPKKSAKKKSKKNISKISEKLIETPHKISYSLLAAGVIFIAAWIIFIIAYTNISNSPQAVPTGTSEKTVTDSISEVIKNIGDFITNKPQAPSSEGSSGGTASGSPRDISTSGTEDSTTKPKIKVQSTPGNINSCQVIDTSGTYTLTANVSASDTCFTITANDVIIDCNDYKISYAESSTGYGILANGASGLNVINCIITNTPRANSHGIYFNDSTYSSLSGNTINIGGSGTLAVYAQNHGCADNSGLSSCDELNAQNLCSVVGCSADPGTFSCSGSVKYVDYGAANTSCSLIEDETTCDENTNGKCQWSPCSFAGGTDIYCGYIDNEIMCNGDTSGFCYWDYGNSQCYNTPSSALYCEGLISQDVCEVQPSCAWTPSCGGMPDYMGGINYLVDCSMDPTNWAACAMACESPGPLCGGSLSGSCSDITSQSLCSENTTNACSWDEAEYNVTLSNPIFSDTTNWLSASAGLSLDAPKFTSAGTTLSFADINFTESRIIDNSNLIIGAKSIYINSEELPELNTSANINFTGLTYQYPVISYDPEDDGTYIPCPSDICTQNSYSGGILSFSVTHFTGYGLGENASITIWDNVDAGMPFGGQTKYPNEQVKFFANYTNVTGPMLNGDCSIAFNDQSGTMTYNSTSTFYEYNRTFSSATTYGWNVSCNSTTSPFITNISDDITISMPTGNLAIWDETNSAGLLQSGQTKYANESVTFFANFTNSTGGAANTTNGGCKIDFEYLSAYSGFINMGFNTTHNIYLYNRTFSTNGTYNWKVTCAGTVEGINETDTFTITSLVPPGGSDVPEFTTFTLILALIAGAIAITIVRKNTLR